MGINYKLTRANTAKLVGAVLVAGSAIASICSQAINPQGFTRGYPTPYDLISYTLPINALLCFLSICVAINTANWFWIGLAAVSPIFRGKEGWGWPSHLIVWGVTVYSVILAIYLAVVQVDQLGFDTYLYVSAGTILVLLIFSLVSGIFVLVTISNIDHGTPSCCETRPCSWWLSARLSCWPESCSLSLVRSHRRPTRRCTRFGPSRPRLPSLCSASF